MSPKDPTRKGAVRRGGEGITGTRRCSLQRRCSIGTLVIVRPRPITAYNQRFDVSAVHAWNYRRYIVASWPLIRTKDDELNYTKKKIQSNFSNFSAWHQRSKLLGAIWEIDSATPAQCDQGMPSPHVKARPTHLYQRV